MDEVALAPADEVALAAGHIVRVSAEIGRVGRQRCVRGSVHGGAASTGQRRQHVERTVSER